MQITTLKDTDIYLWHKQKEIFLLFRQIDSNLLNVCFVTREPRDALKKFSAQEILTFMQFWIE